MPQPTADKPEPSKRKGATEPEEDSDDEGELGDRSQIDDADVAAIKQFYDAQLEAKASPSLLESISKDELKSLTCSVMRLMIFKSFKQQYAPVPKADLMGLVSQNYKGLSRRGLPSYVIASAQVKFIDLFGLEMKELVKTQKHKTREKQRKMVDPSDKSGTKVMVLRTLIQPYVFAEIVQGNEHQAYQGFYQVVMSLISMSGGQLHERSLWKSLGKIGVNKGDRRHPALGNVDALLASMVKKRYLQAEKVVDDQGEGLLYEMAENGQDLLPRKTITGFLDQMGDVHE